MRLPSPEQILSLFPLSKEEREFIEDARNFSTKIVQGKGEKIALLVGPCSIHDEKGALEYGRKLKDLSLELDNFFVIMRFFIEKPRTKNGWKGFVYDPDLNYTHNIANGITRSRKLLLKLAKEKVPCALELLDPLVLPYIEDLITWGMIGARTSASQPHRQLASGLNFPIGFKNSVHGEIDVAIQGIQSANEPHSHISIDNTGHIIQKITKGNPFSFLTLRGSNTHSNYDPLSISHATEALKNGGLNPHLAVDCSHGNSKKNHLLQSQVFMSCIEQIASGNDAIFGLMLESYLKEGKQNIDTSSLQYGVSITDSCLSFEQTKDLLYEADEVLSRSMSSVHR